MRSLTHPSARASLSLERLRHIYHVHQRALKRAGALLLLFAGLLLLYLLVVPELITRAYAGATVPFLSERIRPTQHPLAYYLAQSRLLFSRAFLVLAVLQLAATALLFRAHTARLVKSFFAATTAPLNLAIFRIVLFAVLIDTVNPPRLVWLSTLPAELRFAPSGLKPLLPLLPITPTLVTVAAALFYLFCFTSLVGLWTRVSTVLALLVGGYVLLVPQLFGKVDHNHHLIWFMALLAVSRCGDALSLDAIRAAWRRADRGDTAPPASAQVYALPLRFAWLLIGVLYLFPGFWKFWSSGFDWAFSENLKFRMYDKWMSLDGWQPIFRIDQFPPLYQMAALGTIIFELTFIVLIFFPIIRQLLALGGILFHSMIYMFMHISFFTLITMYVIFFDWTNMFRWCGQRLFPREMIVLYDGNCGVCRRTIATLRAFDVFEQIRYVNALDQAVVDQLQLGAIDSMALLVDMHAVAGQQHWAGFAAYRAIAWRIPLLWPLLPLLYIRPVAVLGQRVYRRVADSRACRIAPPPVPTLAQHPGRWARLSTYAPMAVGSGLVVGNMLFGALHIESGWPLACYPRFAGLAEPETISLQVVALRADGQPIPISQEVLKSDFSPAQFVALVQRIARSDDDAVLNRRLRALWAVWVGEEPALQQAAKVQFYTTSLAVSPERQRENPLTSELLLEIDP